MWAQTMRCAAAQQSLPNECTCKYRRLPLDTHCKDRRLTSAKLMGARRRQISGGITTLPTYPTPRSVGALAPRLWHYEFHPSCFPLVFPQDPRGLCPWSTPSEERSLQGIDGTTGNGEEQHRGNSWVSPSKSGCGGVDGAPMEWRGIMRNPRRSTRFAHPCDYRGPKDRPS